ncbi:ATP-binding cassette domain-containing protein [Kitasatospora sp. NPDC048540]|uniref:ATP-binding cassette domain-containing protein n=1 Tax=Kitasatospora sp. NPDC048540 TaxID=3155634 RepID=UPI0033C516D1
MIQTTGLTKTYRRRRPPAVLDLTFDARPGVVTALLGAEGAGKTTAVRLMVELERGLGVTLFGGRTYRSLRRPEREVGVLLPTGTAAMGHPGQRAYCHLRMLAASIGVPARRADELLEQTRLAGVADHRLRSFSPGMSRRLGLAAALLGSPGTLLLDTPTDGLSPRSAEWFHSFVRSFAVAGGTVLVTTRTPEEAAAVADRVITLDQGRLASDQPAGEFRRARLHHEVSVRGPQMARLADLLTGQGGEVRPDGTTGIAVTGIGRTEIGELAYRHGILLHELADRVVDRPAQHLALPTTSGRSGHVQLQAQPQAPHQGSYQGAHPSPLHTPPQPPAHTPHQATHQAHHPAAHPDSPSDSPPAQAEPQAQPQLQSQSRGPDHQRGRRHARISAIDTDPLSTEHLMADWPQTPEQRVPDEQRGSAGEPAHPELFQHTVSAAHSVGAAHPIGSEHHSHHSHYSEHQPDTTVTHPAPGPDHLSE